MTFTRDGSLPDSSAEQSALMEILSAATEEQMAKYGTQPNTDYTLPVPNNFVIVGAFRYLPVIMREGEPLLPSTPLWVWPYQDPQLLDGWTLSQIEAMFPFWEPRVGI